MQILKNQFENRESLIDYVKNIAPWAEGEASDINGGRDVAESLLNKIDPTKYGYTRNYGNGKVTKLSPYIHHGVLSLNEVRNRALSKSSNSEEIEKFIQELCWRDFLQKVLIVNPNWAWEDVEPYKTGFSPTDYSDQLPDDIAIAKTGVACIDAFIKELITTGYIHNHSRMYLASYIVHFRRVKWQVGARWFLSHLLDGNVASNNLSWQWIASTFSNKPYIFNLENVDKYFGKLVDTSPLTNKCLDKSYEELKKQLFSLMEDRYE